MAAILEFWRRAGPQQALVAALRPYVPELYRLAFRLTGSEADSEDLLQDLVVKLHGRADEIAALDRPGIWLARVVYRQYVDSYRRAGRRPVPVSELGCDEAGNDPVAALADRENNQPERLAERALQARHLLAALDRLSPEHRDLVILHDVEGYRLSELEALLALPLGTLKSRLHRGRRRLRAMLGGGTK